MKANTTEVFKNHTKRYCLVCEGITTFSYLKGIGHSECMNCGARFGLSAEQLSEAVQDWVQQQREKTKG